MAPAFSEPKPVMKMSLGVQIAALPGDFRRWDGTGRCLLERFLKA